MVVRETLESMAARLAVQRNPKGTAEIMAKTIAKARRAYREGQLSELITANQGFHQVWWKAAGIRFLSAMYHTLQGYIGLMMSVSLSWPRRPVETIQEHGEIIRALEAARPRCRGKSRPETRAKRLRGGFQECKTVPDRRKGSKEEGPEGTELNPDGGPREKTKVRGSEFGFSG